jgi:hypothetical protein
VRLASVLPKPGSQTLYNYDFGDYWQHDVRLEAILPCDPGIQYPRILAGKRSCPPEDCSGTGGYTEGSNDFVTSISASIATGWSEPVPGRDYLPQWTNALSRRTE